jgi:hypothetical protein
MSGDSPNLLSSRELGVPPIVGLAPDSGRFPSSGAVLPRFLAVPRELGRPERGRRGVRRETTGVGRSMLDAPHLFGMRGFRVLAAWQQGVPERGQSSAPDDGGNAGSSLKRSVLCFACSKTLNIDIARDEYLGGGWNAPLATLGRPPWCGELSALRSFCSSSPRS